MRERQQREEEESSSVNEANVWKQQERNKKDFAGRSTCAWREQQSTSTGGIQSALYASRSLGKVGTSMEEEERSPHAQLDPWQQRRAYTRTMVFQRNERPSRGGLRTRVLVTTNKGAGHDRAAADDMEAPHIPELASWHHQGLLGRGAGGIGLTPATGASQSTSGWRWEQGDC